MIQNNNIVVTGKSEFMLVIKPLSAKCIIILDKQTKHLRRGLISDLPTKFKNLLVIQNNNLAVKGGFELMLVIRPT